MGQKVKMQNALKHTIMKNAKNANTKNILSSNFQNDKFQRLGTQRTPKRALTQIKKSNIKTLSTEYHHTYIKYIFLLYFE